MRPRDRYMPARVKLVGRDQLSVKSAEIFDTLQKDAKNADLLWFKGLANTPTDDRDEELILNEAHTRAIPKFLRGTPAVTLGHEFDAARAANIGIVTDAAVIVSGNPAESGLSVEGYIGTNSKAQDIRTNLKEGVPVDFSVAFIHAERRDPTPEELSAFPKVRRVITDYELLNIGAVNIGSNRNSHMSLRGRKAAPGDPAAADPATVPAGTDVATWLQQGMELLGEAAALFAQCMDAMQSQEPADPNAPVNAPAPPARGVLSIEASATAERILSQLKIAAPAAGGK